jgi:hypothetical protein
VKPRKKVLLYWIVALLFISFSCAMVYLVDQQMMRQGANEEPLRIAQDTALKLERGQTVKSAVPADKVDISKSLSPFVMVFDNDKKLLAASGSWSNTLPTYPGGVLDNTLAKGETRVTWQPQNGLRFATVAVKYSQGYVVGASSLQETEKRIAEMGKIVSLAWLAGALFSAFVLLIYGYLNF